MDVLLIQEQLRQTLSSLIRRVGTVNAEAESRLGEMLADGLTRYLVYAQRPAEGEDADLELMLDSLEFWAELHGYSRRKPVQKQNGPAYLHMTASAGR